MPLIQAISLYLSGDGWQLPPIPGEEVINSLRIDVLATSDGLDVRAIEYHFRDVERSIVGSLTEEILASITMQLCTEETDVVPHVCGCGECDICSGVEVDTNLALQLERIACRISPEDISGILAPYATIFQSRRGWTTDDLERQLVDVFLAEVSFYLVLTELLYEDVLGNVLPFSFRLPYEGLDSRSLTYTAIHYLTYPFETVRLTGNRFANECGWLVQSFFNCWAISFATGEKLDTACLIHSVINGAVTATIDRLGKERASLGHDTADRLGVLEAELSLLRGQRERQLQVMGVKFDHELCELRSNLERMVDDLRSKLVEMERHLSLLERTVGDLSTREEERTTRTTRTTTSSTGDVLSSEFSTCRRCTGRSLTSTTGRSWRGAGRGVTALPEVSTSSTVRGISPVPGKWPVEVPDYYELVVVCPTPESSPRSSEWSSLSPGSGTTGRTTSTTSGECEESSTSSPGGVVTPESSGRYPSHYSGTGTPSDTLTGGLSDHSMLRNGCSSPSRTLEPGTLLVPMGDDCTGSSNTLTGGTGGTDGTEPYDLIVVDVDHSRDGREGPRETGTSRTIEESHGGWNMVRLPLVALGGELPSLTLPAGGGLDLSASEPFSSSGRGDCGSHWQDCEETRRDETPNRTGRAGLRGKVRQCGRVPQSRDHDIGQLGTVPPRLRNHSRGHRNYR